MRSNPRKAVMAEAARLGAVVTVQHGLASLDIEVEAPAGMVWNGTSCGVIVECWDCGEYRAQWEYVLSIMRQGLSADTRATI